MTHTIGWRERAASRTRSDSRDDLDPSLVYRLEPLSLALGILVCDRADEVVAPAVLVDLARVPLDDDLVHQHLGQRTSITADRFSQARDGSGSSGMAASLVRLLCSLSS